MREISTTVSSQHANSLSLNSAGNQGANVLGQYGLWGFCEVTQRVTNNEWQIWGINRDYPTLSNLFFGTLAHTSIFIQNVSPTQEIHKNLSAK